MLLLQAAATSALDCIHWNRLPFHWWIQVRIYIYIYIQCVHVVLCLQSCCVHLVCIITVMGGINEEYVYHKCWWNQSPTVCKLPKHITFLPLGCTLDEWFDNAHWHTTIHWTYYDNAHWKGITTNTNFTKQKINSQKSHPISTSSPSSIRILLQAKH